MQQKYMPLLIALATLVLLPFVLPAVGLTLTTATDVVIFAIACKGLYFGGTCIGYSNF